jgi:transposase-like protein
MDETCAQETVPAGRESYAERAARCAYVLAAPGTLAMVAERVAEGETVAGIARAWDVPAGRLMGWVLADGERTRQYEAALRVQAHTRVEEAVGIADAEAGDVARDKLRIETRWKLAAHHAKERYGVQGTGGGGTRVQVVVQRSPALERPVPEAVAIEATTHTEEVAG